LAAALRAGPGGGRLPWVAGAGARRASGGRRRHHPAALPLQPPRSEPAAGVDRQHVRRAGAPAAGAGAPAHGRDDCVVPRPADDDRLPPRERRGAAALRVARVHADERDALASVRRASASRAARWPSFTSTKASSIPPTAKKTMIDRTALRLEPVALIMIVKTAGPRMPANFSNTEKKAKNSDDLCRGTRVEKTDRLSAWLPPCTVPTSSASTKKSRAV